MTTPPSSPLSRRTFLARLMGAAAMAPLAVAAAKQTPTFDESIRDMDVRISRTRAAADVLLQGVAIKVPSNRSVAPWSRRGVPEGVLTASYVGPWDGTFKLERGCTNPAYILADLYERTGKEPDWVTGLRGTQISADGTVTPAGFYLNWQMLYDWGRFCDEATTDRRGHYRPRFRLAATNLRGTYKDADEMIALRERLRMHCLSWQSTDPRYRTSYPGIPYPHA